MKKHHEEHPEGLEEIIGEEDNYIDLELLKNCLNKLNKFEKKIINMRYGLANGKGMTLEDIANALNFTKAYIQQVEMNALEKMRSDKIILGVRKIDKRTLKRMESL